MVPCSSDKTHEDVGCLIQDGVAGCFTMVVPEFGSCARDAKATIAEIRENASRTYKIM